MPVGYLLLLLLISKMKVVAMPEVYLYNLSLRRALDAARFFFLVVSFLSLVTNFFHDVIIGGPMTCC